jgi:hypothetical protein
MKAVLEDRLNQMEFNNLADARNAGDIELKKENDFLHMRL